MKQQISVYSKKLFLPVIIFSALLVNACRVTFVPDYNAQLSEQIDNTAKEVDKFYLTMLETTTSDNVGRAYSKFAEQYVGIEAELNSLLSKNKMRALNENSTRICEITLQLWQKYKKEHKEDNTIANGLIQLNQKTFSDLFFAMQVAEKAKEIVANPPQ